jgi:hypothetical protein
MGFLDALGIKTSTPTAKNTTPILDKNSTRNTIALIGTMRVGKSTHVGGLLIAASTYVKLTKDNVFRFKCIPNDAGTNLLECAADLRSGKFPQATTSGQKIRELPSLTLEWSYEPTGKALIGWRKQAVMPILDLAGEDLVRLIDQVNDAEDPDQITDMKAIQELTTIVKTSSALLVVSKITRNKAIAGNHYEPEPTSITGMSQYSDINLVHMILEIVKYKHRNPLAPALRRVGVVVTALDKVPDIAKKLDIMGDEPFDPTDPLLSEDSLEKLFSAAYPETYGVLVSLGIQVNYFPSVFITEKDKLGNELYWDPETKKSPKIKLRAIHDPEHPENAWHNNMNKPQYSEAFYLKELEWLKEFAELK